MHQYQSFPDAAGDSRTLDKLKALRLPVLEGRRFLDVGCNEGFFCGFAHFMGASQSVGLDRSRDFIARARQRFPECTFHACGWDRLPVGPFDAILLASALHYADDQSALLHTLVEHLAPDGVLVLELGIVSSKKAEWVKVKRGIDERYFPTMPLLKEVLAPYAWKWMGPSIAQDGDPVPRHVLHVSVRRPVAYLMMQPPAHGKSSLASQLFVPAGVKVVSGDEQVSRIARGETEAPQRLQRVIEHDFSPFTIDRTIQRVFDKGLASDLVSVWVAAAGKDDFALDGYVPPKYHDEVEQSLTAAGYLPVRLMWNRSGPSLLPDDQLGKKSEAFFRTLSEQGPPPPTDAPAPPPATEVEGFVDRLELDNGKLIIGGWARTTEGGLPASLTVRMKGTIVTVDDFERRSRPDVQKHLSVDEAQLGYRIVLDAEGLGQLHDLGREFSVSPPNGVPFRVTASVARELRSG